MAVEVPNRGYFGAELGSGGCFCLGRPNLRIRSMSVAAAFVAIFHSYWHIAYLDELFQRATRQTRAVHCQRMGDTACAIDGVISVVSARVLQGVCGSIGRVQRPSLAMYRRIHRNENHSHSECCIPALGHMQPSTHAYNSGSHG